MDSLPLLMALPSNSDPSSCRRLHPSQARALISSLRSLPTQGCPFHNTKRLMYHIKEHDTGILIGIKGTALPKDLNVRPALISYS